ncbi:MAG: polysaccharide deacetylase family protein [Lachnospiraceae bacterium]|nr:polysaccharide deacetylase family protein [Lachnospiraceae bacterium]
MPVPWGADDTDELLRILKENDVKTTFFMCGYWVDDYPEEVVKIAMDGHDLGNHSSTHPHMSQLSKEQIKKEIKDAHDKVFALTGYEMELFRPPFGEYDNNVIEAAQDIGYYTIQWDVEGMEIM